MACSSSERLGTSERLNYKFGRAIDGIPKTTPCPGDSCDKVLVCDLLLVGRELS